MTISQVDISVKNLVDMYHVYGVETIFNALARACKDDKYLTSDHLHAMLDNSIVRTKEVSCNEDTFYN